jgi:hypothetical protein
MKFPRYLAPTIGPAASRVEFQEGAQGEIGSTVAVGESIQFGSLGFVMDDFKWQPAVSPVAHGEIIPIDGINIFIGYVGSEAGLQDAVGSNLETEQVGDNLDNGSEDYASSICPVLDEEG